MYSNAGHTSSRTRSKKSIRRCRPARFDTCSWAVKRACSTARPAVLQSHPEIAGSAAFTVLFEISEKLCDPIGTFMRQDERRDFYERHPNASLMGKMVVDARHAIDAATELMDEPRPIYLYGYAVGGTVAMMPSGLMSIRISATSRPIVPHRTPTTAQHWRIDLPATAWRSTRNG